MLTLSENLWPFSAVFNSGTSQCHMETHLADITDGPI